MYAYVPVFSQPKPSLFHVILIFSQSRIMLSLVATWAISSSSCYISEMKLAGMFHSHVACPVYEHMHLEV